MTPEEILARVFTILFIIFSVSILVIMICWAFLKVVALSIEILSDVWFDIKLAFKEAIKK